MEIYQVGGCVRDRLLGRPVHDRDWVVVGATPQEMLDRGFRPVGKDFPVFLHPQSNEEYALARTERKTAPGYKGFAFHAAPDVTLAQDLARRDLTINAMALDDAGRLIDPYGGRRDLEARVLRHVGPHFVEDPVRILRVARFAARFADFVVAAETRELLRAMVDGGEADALVAERVWREIAQGLMERHPARMLEVLRDCGLGARLFAELPQWDRAGPALDEAARRDLPLPTRFALLASSATLDAALIALSARLRVDADSAQLARLLRELRAPLRDARGATAIVDALERSDALRRPARFETLLQASEVLDGGERIAWRRALAAARAVDSGAIAAAHRGDPARIREAIHAARVAAAERALLPPSS